MAKHADLGEDAVVDFAAVNGDIAVTLVTTVVQDVKADRAGVLQNLLQLPQVPACVAVLIGRLPAKAVEMVARTMATALLDNTVTRICLLVEDPLLLILLLTLLLTLLLLLPAEYVVEATGIQLTVAVEKLAATTTTVLPDNLVSRI
jgi:hypothetical protein